MQYKNKNLYTTFNDIFIVRKFLYVTTCPILWIHIDNYTYLMTLGWAFLQRPIDIESVLN